MGVNEGKRWVSYHSSSWNLQQYFIFISKWGSSGPFKTIIKLYSTKTNPLHMFNIKVTKSTD